MRDVSEGVRVACGVPVSGKKDSHVRNGVSSLLVAIVFAGYGFFRYSERPIFGVTLIIVGLLNAFVSGASFVLAILRRP